MTGERDLPLHDEAEARSEWRGGETLPGRDELGTSGPASEVDDAAEGGRGTGGAEDELLKEVAQTPPD